ncbi:mannosyltransferase [Chamberlinius hualienensis]
MASVRRRRVCVVVLGDIGRSPRMMFHAMSLAEEGFPVDLIGYGGSTPSQKLLKNKLITVRHMSEPPLCIKRMPRLLGYGFKALWQFLTLLYALFSVFRASHVLVQNPPSVPTLAAVWLYSTIQRCKLIIDWHNYGYSILALSLSNKHLLVRFSKWFEIYFGGKAQAHLCVTKALKSDLATHNIDAVVLYDRPPDVYRPLSEVEKIEFLKMFDAEYLHVSDGTEDCSTTRRDHLKLLEITDEGDKFRNNRPVLLVSSTSWTEDEDFSVLLAALKNYEDSKLAIQNSNIPHIICVITGKGPLKEYYEKKISEMQFQCIDFCFPWLSAEDYPKLLASADLGVCLHTSSSGLDLPMKVVDMLGCGLPVLAIKYKCIDELVKTGSNGYVFEDSDELNIQLQMLLKGSPSLELETLRRNVKKNGLISWETSWKRNAYPLF